MDGAQSRRCAGANSVSSPWTHIVRGGDPEAVPSTTPSPSSASSFPAIPGTESIDRSSESFAPEVATVESSDTESSSNGARAKKPAWSKLSNDAVEVGPVMGALSWPALSESARASPRSSSDSLRVSSEGSASVSVSQVPVIPSSPQKPTGNNANPNSNPNHAFPVRQKSMKRSGGPPNVGVIIPVSPLPPSLDTLLHAASDKADGVAVVPESSLRDPQHKNNWEAGSKVPLVPQFHNGNSHPRNSFRRGNGGGPHPRGGSGDGPYPNIYANRRDHRPNHEWSLLRNFNGRDGHMQQQRFMPRNFHRPPPTSHPFVSPSPIRPFGNPLGYPDMASPYIFVPPPPPDSLRGGVQYIAHVVPPVMYFPQQDPQLLSLLLKQIDYYFSSDNLCKDTYLRQNMDEHGWVPISLIANFNRVKQLTKDVQSILTAVQTSSVVELQGNKIRKRNDWMNWLLSPSNQYPVVSNPRTSKLDMLAARMQSVGLEGTISDDNNEGHFRT